jgi:hypothetical protein
MQALQDRMKYLRRGEAIGATVLPLVCVLKWSRSDMPVAWDLRGAAIILVSFILLQGTLYWHLKMRSLDQRAPLPGYFYKLFRSFQVVNMLAIATMLVALLRTGAGREDVLWASWLMVLVVLEQINYFHYQLMYDARGALASMWRNGRLRKAALALDLARSR